MSPTSCSSGTTPARSCRRRQGVGGRRRRQDDHAVYLRKGMKWSDGQPFTADDFMFWYEDLYLNKELTPTPTSDDVDQRQAGHVEKVDETTVRFKFPEPYYLFVTSRRRHGDQRARRRTGAARPWAATRPAHYLKQFHPEVRRPGRARQEGQGGQVRQLGQPLQEQERLAPQPRSCRRSPWKTVTPINTPTVDAGAEPVLLRASTPRATSSRTSTRSR